MKNDINDSTWLTQFAAVKIARNAVDAICCRKTPSFFNRPMKIERLFERQAQSPSFAQALSDKLAPLIEVDIHTIKNINSLTDFSSLLLSARETPPGFTVRLFGAMSLMFDYLFARTL